MSNKVSKLLTFIVETLQANPLVNTVAFKDDNVVDVEKENIYPLVNIVLLPSPQPQWNSREYRIGFEVFNQRDDTKKPTPDKLMSDTNYIDNIGICDSIANNFCLEVMKVDNDLNIFINDNGISDFEFVRKDERNALDGVKFEITFLTDQNGI